jgi:site-specific DNA-methyltransferase (adenine-specific)
VSEDVRVIHGDCLSVLPTLDGESIAAVVTDPPYGAGWKHSGRPGKLSTTGKSFGIEVGGDNRDFDPSPWMMFPAVAFTGAQYFYDRLPSGGSLHVWNKRGHYKPLDHGDGDIVWINRRACCRVFDLVWRGICRHAEHDQMILHPTQKPVALMLWMMDLLGIPEGATVLDPYAGSGTLGVACLKSGRKCILIESDARYIPVINRRLADAATPLLDGAGTGTGIGIGPVPRAVAGDLFAGAADRGGDWDKEGED